MADEQVVPIWTLSSGGSDDAWVQRLHEGGGELNQARLDGLRTALAALSDDPPVVMERYAVARQDVPAGGRLVAAGSPMAKTLAEIAGKTRQVAPTEATSGATEVLYRIVVPEKLAGLLAQGTAHQMSASGGGVYSAIRGGRNIVGNAKFVPVATTAGGGAAAGGAAAMAGAGAVGAVLAAAPVVLLLAATAGSVYAEEQRRHALERVENLLNERKYTELNSELDELNGAVKAIRKATALLADEGRLGKSLGLDSAVNRIDTAVSTAERRLGDWERALAKFNGTATPATLKAAFPGLGASNGMFEAQLRMAVFAITMKRRVAILQAAEHTQADRELSLSRFNRELAGDAEDLAVLEGRIAGLLSDLANVKIEAPKKRIDVVYKAKEVRELLLWTPYLRSFAARETPTTPAVGDLEICFVTNDDGSIRVLDPTAEPNELAP